MLAEAVKRYLSEHKELADLEIVDLGVGPLYSYSKLETGSVGLFYSFLEEYNGPPLRLEELLASPRVRELVEFAWSSNMVERVLLFASLNALGQYVLRDVELEAKSAQEVLAELLEGVRARSVAVVGHMRPLVEELRELGLKIYVFERDPSKRRGEALSDVFEELLLPKADAVVLTGSALALPTLDRVLELCKRASLKAIVGPSASAPPDFLMGLGFDLVGGCLVRDGERAAKMVMLGAGFKTLKRAGLLEEYVLLRESKS